jgi:FlaA1/EpsC-like NDP-sugar epimerase
LASYRRPVMIAIDASLIVLAYCGAFALRFDGQISPDRLAIFEATFFWVVGLQLAFYMTFRVNEAIWRYVSLGDVTKIATAAAIAMSVFALIDELFLKVAGFPRSVYVLDPLVQISLLGGTRALRRLAHNIRGADRGKRVLIFGAGDAGEMIVRDMKYKPYFGYSPVGFIDDDPLKNGRSIHGVRVLGTRADVPRIMARTSPDEVLVAMPGVEPSTLRAILKALEAHPVPVKTLPNIRDILNGRVSVTDIRNVALTDLLGRTPAGLDPERVRDFFAGKRVMVTGAGGSIGSELCRQISALGVQTLTMYERYENSLYAIENELRGKVAGASVVGVIGDVCDRSRLAAVLSAHQIDVVFHAAAHKHVPLMELNPCEAIKNNICGTRTVAEVAARHGVERLILVSTDKAVNPANVMGASKRVAELLIQDLARTFRRGFAVVRFGNVLGSNGSVVPRFLEQIRAGGPVTITHPSVTRFFMLIPEAAQLVLHAAAIAEPGAIYTLQMGEQIKIEDLACHLIRLAGYTPGHDIKIEYIGLRPGEKLYEELVGENEHAEPSAVESVLVMRNGAAADSRRLADQIRMLEACANEGDESSVIALLSALVPTFGTVGTDKTRERNIMPDPALREIQPSSSSIPAYKGTAK